MYILNTASAIKKKAVNENSFYSMNVLKKRFVVGWN